jgi:lipopolysaccharide biosynthesis regulator YciM
LENNERKAELYNRANQYRKNNLFDRATDVYNSMVKEFLNEAEAYWGLVLCRYGIEYVEDPKTKK